MTSEITREELKQQEVTIKSFLKEEKKEERLINTTKCNIIVHNLDENKRENLEEQQKDDKDFVEQV